MSSEQKPGFREQARAVINAGLERPKKLASQTRDLSLRVGTGLLRTALTTLAYTGPITVETARATRDALAQIITGTDTRPYLVKLGEEGYEATYISPVVQLFGFNYPGSLRRVNEAVKKIMSGDLKFFISPERRMPPGKKQGEHKLIPVAKGKRGTIVNPLPNAAGPLAKLGNFAGRTTNSLSETTSGLTRSTRQNLLDILSGGIPVATITFSTDHLSRAYLELMKEGKLPTDYGSSLVDTNVMFSISWIDRQKGGITSQMMSFPLGNMPLRFDNTGRIVNAPYKVIPDSKKDEKDVEPTFYHPAILGLRSFCGVVSEVIRRKTDRLATISPESIAYAFVSAAKAGGHMGEVLGPHLERMHSIEQVEGWLARDPSLVLKALPRVIRLVDDSGEEHSKANDIWSDIASSVVGSTASRSEAAVSWPQLVLLTEKLTKEHGAMAIWEGERLMITELVQHAGESHELSAMYKRLLGEKARGMKEGMVPVPAVALLADGSAPTNILVQIYAELAERNAYGHVARQGATRRAAFAELIRQISSIYTQNTKQYLRNFREGYTGSVAPLAAIGTVDGNAVGKSAIDSYSPTGAKEAPAQIEKSKGKGN